MARAKQRIIIIGGSIAGLFAGVLLRRAGCEVDIYERAGQALASRGAGITTHDALYAALGQAGIHIHDKLAIESRCRVMLDQRGAELGWLDMPQLMTSWTLLYRLLRERFPECHYHDSHELRTITTQQHGVVATFDNGT